MKFPIVLSVASAACLASGASAANTTIDFESVALGTPTNGLVQPGVSFAYDRFGAPSPSSTVQNFLNGPPFVTGNAIIGDLFEAELKLDFSTPVTSLSYGFAISRSGFVADASTIQVFDPMGGSLGSFSVDGDSVVFRGIAETTRGENSVSGLGPIGSAIVTFNFNSTDLDRSVPIFAFDNLTFSTAVPLPTGAAMGLAALVPLSAIRRRRSA